MRVVSAERVERAKLLRTGRACKVIAHVQNVQSYCAHSERACNPVASAHYLCHFVVDFRDLIKPVFCRFLLTDFGKAMAEKFGFTEDIDENGCVTSKVYYQLLRKTSRKGR